MIFGRLINILVMVLLAIGFSFSMAVNTANAAAVQKKETAEPESEFVAIPPINVAMYNKRKRPAGTLTVLLQLKIDDQAQRAEAQKVMPRLKSAYMQETMKLAMNFFDVNRPVNANILGRSLQKVTNKLLNHDGARVLIGNIAVQKRR